MKLGGGRQPEEERERKELKGKYKKKSKLGSDVEGKKSAEIKSQKNNPLASPDHFNKKEKEKSSHLFWFL